MSAPTSRSSMSLLTKCKPCPSTSISPRCFSTTTSKSSIGPENPRFIEVPQPPQPTAKRPKIVRGILPPPRDLFPSRGPNRTTPEYLAKTTPEPAKLKKPSTDYAAWKQRMSASRREHLRESLQQLHARKSRKDAVMAHKSWQKRQDNEARLHAPPREDDRLMSSTVRQAMSQLQKGILPDPNREAEIEAKKLRWQAKEAEKKEQRMYEMHTLYMNARKFITTEEQLNAKIEEEFSEQPWKHRSDARNIWDALDAPPTVQEMLAASKQSARGPLEARGGGTVIASNRMTRMAEELTGGKMD